MKLIKIQSFMKIKIWCLFILMLQRKIINNEYLKLLLKLYNFEPDNFPTYDPINIIKK